MKKFILTLVAAAGISVAGFAQTWSLDKSHAKLGFTITHLSISEVEGSFRISDAKFTSTKSDFSDAVFEMTADVKTVNTENDSRDEHLRKPDYFDAEKFPTINFKSTSFTKQAGNKYLMKGNLTMHGVTKPVTLNVTLNGPMEHPRNKKQMVGIKATGTINRTDFGVGSSPAAMLGHEVEIRAMGEFVKN